MMCISKILKSKLRSSFGKEGQHKKENANSSMLRTVINEEYKQTFRTNSYIEICNKIQSKFHINDANQPPSSPSSPTSPSSTPPPIPSEQHICLSEYLVGPTQLETLAPITKNPNLHHFLSLSPSLPPPPPLSEHVNLSEYLVGPTNLETLFSIIRNPNPNYQHFLTDYLNTSLEAGRVCEFILENIHQLRYNYHAIREAIELLKFEPDHISWSQNQNHNLRRNLACFASHDNPFAALILQKFQDLHQSHQRLLYKLKCTKTKKKKKLTRFIKRALKIMGCRALSFLLLATQCTEGFMAAPGVIASSVVVLLMKKLKGRSNRKEWEVEEAHIDAAARGVYILINDFDTMSRLVQRLHDEMDHRKFVAGVCVKKGKNEALKEVIKEFQMHEFGFLEQVDELERQIYLCFLDINRSRRLLIQELNI